MSHLLVQVSREGHRVREQNVHDCSNPPRVHLLIVLPLVRCLPQARAQHLRGHERTGTDERRHHPAIIEVKQAAGQSGWLRWTHPALFIVLLNPKSTSLTIAHSVLSLNITFSGFKSRCTIPASCICAGHRLPSAQLHQWTSTEKLYMLQGLVYLCECICQRSDDVSRLVLGQRLCGLQHSLQDGGTGGELVSKSQRSRKSGGGSRPAAGPRRCTAPSQCICTNLFR